MESTLHFRAVYSDGVTPDYTMDGKIQHTDEQGLVMAKAKMLNMYSQMGGVLIDRPDGSVELHPFSRFEKILITSSAVVLATIQ